MKDCGIVKDLLPLYAEDMASEESAAFVRTHLEICEDCKKAFESMKTPVEAEPAAPLKTVKRAVKKRGLLIAGLIACLVAAIAASFLARILKPIVIRTSGEAFVSVRREGLIRTERIGEDLYLLNVELDPETGKAYLIGDGGERVSLDDLNASEKDGPLEDRLVLETQPGVDVMLETNEGEVSVSAYTTLYARWFRSDGEPTQTVVPLNGVNAVFFEPYNGTERATLYQRDGYTPEAGCALPRLVMNHYFLIALVGTAVLAAAWIVLRLLKKQKASRICGILLLIAGSLSIAFLAAGFPATTIAPARELAFVLVITALFVGAGLSARALFGKE